MSAAEKRFERPWTPADLAQLKAYVASGMTVPMACDAAGLRWSRAKHWIQKGKRFEEPFTEVSDAVLEGTAACDAACHMAVASAMRRDWRAAAYMLDRRDSQRAFEREQKLGRSDGDEKTVLYYPVALPEGAAPDQALPEHAFDTVGEPVNDNDEEGEAYGHEDDE